MNQGGRQPIEHFLVRLHERLLPDVLAERAQRIGKQPAIPIPHPLVHLLPLLVVPLLLPVLGQHLLEQVGRERGQKLGVDLAHGGHLGALLVAGRLGDPVEHPLPHVLGQVARSDVRGDHLHPHVRGNSLQKDQIDTGQLGSLGKLYKKMLWFFKRIMVILLFVIISYRAPQLYINLI